jgi:hypothetical protein
MMIVSAGITTGALTMTTTDDLYTRIAQISNELAAMPDADTNPMLVKAREGALVAADALLTISQREHDPDHEPVDSFNGAWRSVWHAMTW